MDTPTPVTQIGKYQILGILGVGGMGVVYRGMDNSMGREVAIKTLTEATDELRQRFQLEARSGVLNHPNIVTVYDFGEQDGNPYIVMEFVPGDSLENLLRGGRQFTLIERLEIVRQVCLALGYAHQKGVVHRDIKPANVMVQPDGNIKIVDFGVARLASHSGHTQAGMVIGTFHYISPERLLGKPADGRADIWSVGVILYQLLTGRLPFPGDDPATLHRVIREAHEPLSSAHAGYPPVLDHILDRALAKDPIDRYETAEEMAADLEAANDDLKREKVGEALGNVKHMIDQEKWTSVRPVLLDLQRLNPQNTEVKRLLREVQEKVAKQQKAMQLHQLLGEAEEAVLTQRYRDALEFYNQATTLDKGNPELALKIEHVRGLKEKAERVAQLLEQAREARGRSDFASAGELIDKALQLDERNTDLRNERARIVQEAERMNRERQRREFSELARGQLAARQYTEAIKNLRAALEIDPTDNETQQLYQGAVERQEEQRRRKIIEQIVAEISESIGAEDYDRALALIQRAQERLPGETVLLKLKAEAETKQRDQSAKRLLEQTSLHVYNVLHTNPQEALIAVQQALAQIPGEPGLLALQEKVAEQIKKTSAEELKSQSLKRAQAAIDEKQFDQAIQILESAAIDCGEIPEIASLLAYAREQRRKVELGLLAANTIRDARGLIEAGNFEAAISLLQPVATETGDASVDQLLRQATNSLADQARRLDAALSRAQALSETNLEEALKLLSSQPEDIQKQPRIRELRARLDADLQQEHQTLDAIRQAGDALQRRDFRNGLQGLESVRQTYGDSPRVASAIAEYKTRRVQFANELLTAAFASATEAIQQGDRERATGALDSVSDVGEFADTGLQANLKKLIKEAQKATPKKPAPPPAPAPQVVPVPQPLSATQAVSIPQAASAQQWQPLSTPAQAAPPAKSKFPWAVVIIVLIVVLLGGGGAGYWFFLRPAAVPPSGALELNASPYAEVLSVTSDQGKAIPLPQGDHWTPLRLDGIPAGKYAVTFKAADGSTQNQSCEVAQTAQICTIEMKPVDDNTIEQIVGGAK
ncbi:MAG: protein kinase [Terracidiphilus sp.]|jgi:serine/threonine-protein kinase